jgi:hypothetical protein
MEEWMFRLTDISMYEYQLEAIDKLQSGMILWGNVGSGKSRTSLYFYCKNYSNKKLLIITTAQKRNNGEWLEECKVFGLKPIIDSWNNIRKYEKYENYFIIFDEDHLTGYGAWSKAFIKMAKCNDWLVLTGTPGDNYSEFMTVFIAKGWYKNKRDFEENHVIYSRYSKYPKVDRYINQGLLEKHRRDILVKMFVEKRPRVHKEIVITQYDISKYKKAYKDKRDENNKPFKNATAFCLYLRKICNEDESKIVKVRELLLKHNKVIIFYNYLYEKEILLKLLKTMRTFNVGEYNGQHHDDIPIGERWAYLCQYTAASEGWNCLLCDTMIFFSMNYSYKAMEQAAGRINRVNTPYKDLYYYYLRTTSSIDLSINRALSTKKNFNESTFIGG